MSVLFKNLKLKWVHCTLTTQSEEAPDVECRSNRWSWFAARPGQAILPHMSRVVYLLPELSKKSKACPSVDHRKGRSSAHSNYLLETRYKYYAWHPHSLRRRKYHFMYLIFSDCFLWLFKILTQKSMKVLSSTNFYSYSCVIALIPF